SEGDSISVGQTLFTIDVAAPGGSTAIEDRSDAARNQESPRRNVSSLSDAVDEPAPNTPLQSDGGPRTSPSSTESLPDAAASPGQRTVSEFEFVLPNIGEGVETADIAEIHVSVGDTVARHDPVMDLETEKAVVELPCDRDGTVTRIHVSAGDTVRVGQQLLTLAAVDAPSRQPAAQPTKTAERRSEKPPASEPAPNRRPPPQTPAAATRVTELVTPDGGRQSSAAAVPLAPVPAAPSTRRLARQLGVDLRNVGGSGPGGRITQDDVQTFVRRSLQERLPAVRERGTAPVLAAGSLAPPPLPDFSKFGLVEREKLSKIGRTAAENLSVSWNVIPHVTQHDRADVTSLEAARKRFSQGTGAAGPKVTMTAIVMKALAACLQEYPKFNSSLDPETSEIVYKRYYHLGCAVDTPSGLLVPVVRDCNRKSIRDIAGEIGELAALARDRKLPIDAMQGATCTVTNLGGIGGTAFTPIVNYPEVCILGLARGQKELQLIDGEITERLMLPLSLSYDHRVINGADAARFMVTLCNLLSDPFQLLSAI
ncbi:MAG: 2-oxo acid dehydrogenase subunit E2, partial [Planctomycetaceae bacterium]